MLTRRERDTYAFILADLDRAIELLGGNSTEAETISPDAPKMMVSIAVAYGLRARANLIMHRYPEAEADARKPIEENYWENLLKLTPYTGETQISRTLDKGRHALLYMMYDESPQDG